MTADGVLQLIDRGWLNTAKTEVASQPIKELVAHWFNVPDFGEPFRGLTSTTADVINRWQLNTRRWEIAF